MSIHFSNDRPAMTYIPDVIDEATNEPIEGTGMVTETHLAAFAKQEQSNLLDPDYDNEPDDELTEEEHKALYQSDEFVSNDEVDPVVLADVSAEIHESNVGYDPEMAAAVIHAPMPDTPANTCVQYLAHQVYAGELTPEAAFNEALMSGINHAELIWAYDSLKEHFQQ